MYLVGVSELLGFHPTPYITVSFSLVLHIRLLGKSPLREKIGLLKKTVKTIDLIFYTEFIQDDIL